MRIFDDRAYVREFWACAYFGIMRQLISVTLHSTQSAVSKNLARSVFKMSGIDKSFIFIIIHSLDSSYIRRQEGIQKLKVPFIILTKYAL